VSGLQEIRLDYALEKYSEAIRVLVGAEPIQNRLTFAAHYLMSLTDRNFPNRPDVARRHQDLIKKLTDTPLSDRSKFLRRPITDDEASELSREVLSIYVEVSGAME
jgi:hypothetical protein